MATKGRRPQPRSAPGPVWATTVSSLSPGGQRSILAVVKCMRDRRLRLAPWPLKSQSDVDAEQTVDVSTADGD